MENHKINKTAESKKVNNEKINHLKIKRRKPEKYLEI